MLCAMTGGTHDDVRCMTAVASGDRGALGTLYDRHGPLMLGVGVKLVRDRTAAEDILHDVFLEVWRAAHQYDEARGSVRAWLLLRMRSRCLDFLKSAAVKRRRPISEAPESIAPAAGEDALAHRELVEVLTKLKPAQREIVTLSYFNGLSSTEIASQLELPVGTVKSRMAAAMRALRGALEESP